MKNIFQKWIFDSSSANKKNFSEVNDLLWINNGLNDTSAEINLATMFYVEDLILQGVNSDEKKEIIPDLTKLHSHKNGLVSSFSVFLTLLLVSQEGKISIITSIQPTKLNLQAILWALGSYTNDDLDQSIVLFIKEFDEKDLFDSLDILNPWLIFYPNLFWHLWVLLLKLDKETIFSYFFINNEPTLFYYLMQSAILYDQSLSMIFLTSEDLQYYKGVETWLKYLDSKIHLSRREIIEFVSRLEEQEENSLRLFGDYLKISLRLDYNLLNQKMLLETLEYTDFRFLLMFYEQLDKIQLKNLYKLIFESSYDDLKYQAIEIFRFFKIGVEIIFFLKIILSWVKTKHKGGFFPPYFQNFFRFLNKCENILLKDHFDEVVSELGSSIRYLVSGSTDRDVLYHLLDYFDPSESEETSRISWYIYTRLFPKVWYTYTKFWSEIMKSN
jgi:hypothetical protein